jgi:hypothetical protein
MTRITWLRRWLRGALMAAAGFCVASPLLPVLYAQEMEETETTENSPLFDDSPIAPVAFDEFQPAEGMESMGMGMASPAPTSRPPARRSGPSTSRTASYRLASVPNMYGDIGQSLGQVSGVVFGARDPNGTLPPSTAFNFDIPAAGGSRRVKIGENNVAMPRDRVFFMYNHFHNVFDVTQAPLTPPGPTITNQTHVDRYTLGFEKMFFDDLWSCEVRMPFNSSFDYNDTAFGINGGNVGNLAIILKNLLYVDETTSVAGGLGIDLPTGSDSQVRLVNNTLDFENDAVHLLPWIGVAHNFNDLFFVNAFAQVDFATSGNEVLGNGNSLGFFNEQNLLYLDLNMGTWLYNDPYARRLTSIALMGELHYTTTIQDTDTIGVAGPFGAFQLQNNYNRQDILNGTVALQFAIADKSFFRVGAVAPLSNQPDRRLFDSELQFQFNRLF